MLLRLKETSECPPDKYRYKFPEDGYTSRAFDRASWFADIQKHYRDNEYPIPANWKQVAEDQLCRLLPPGWCTYDDGRAPSVFMDTRSSIDSILNATRVFSSFVAQGLPLVDHETAEERARTCASCFACVTIPGCAPCVGLSNLVADIVGAGKTEADSILATKSCAWCGCSAQANVWIPVSVSEKGVSDDVLAIAPEWCWKAREIRQLRGMP